MNQIKGLCLGFHSSENNKKYNAHNKGHLNGSIIVFISVRSLFNDPLVNFQVACVSKLCFNEGEITAWGPENDNHKSPLDFLSSLDN